MQPCGVGCSPIRVRRKRLDAIAMLAAMQVFLADDPPPFQAMFRFERALVWEQFVAAADPLDELEADVLTELRLDCRAWREVRRAALGRLHGPRPVEPAALRKVLDAVPSRARPVAPRRPRRVAGGKRARRRAVRAAAVPAEAALDAEAAGRSTRRSGSRCSISLRLTGRFSDLLRAVPDQAGGFDRCTAATTGAASTGRARLVFRTAAWSHAPDFVRRVCCGSRMGGRKRFMLAVWRDYLFNRISK